MNQSAHNYNKDSWSISQIGWWATVTPTSQSVCYIVCVTVLYKTFTVALAMLISVHLTAVKLYILIAPGMLRTTDVNNNIQHTLNLVLVHPNVFICLLGSSNK